MSIKKKLIEDATKQFPVILPADHHETLRRIAFDRKISMAEIIREAVAEWLEKQQKNNK